MKLLLYCTKNKWRLFFDKVKQVFTLGKVKSNNDLNGKIVAECDYEVEKIKKANYDCMLFTNTLDTEKLINKSCVGYFKLEKYLKPNWDKEDNLQNLDTVGYAIHIKNLHIFDEPKELSEYGMDYPISPIVKAPQNMMYANGIGERYILISIRPEHLVNILNGNKTIEIRKKILNEMKEQI